MQPHRIALIVAVAGIVLFTVLAGSALSVSFQNNAVVGPEVVVAVPSWVPVSFARAMVQITPKTDSSVTWIPHVRELHIVPRDGFDPAQEYTASIGLPLHALTARLPFSLSVARLPAALAVVEPDSESSPPAPQPQPPRTTTQPPAPRPQQTAGGKFIDVDLTAMTMTLYENGQRVAQYPVAGKGNPARSPTREGTFSIKTKETNHYSTIAHVWMPWSMQYSGDYFIHEWPYWPGGQRLQTKYSGGCIRLHIGDAKKVFDWAKVGTTITVHSS